MMSPPGDTPRVGDIVHYWPLLVEKPGCRAAMVTDIHYNPQLASLMIAHATGVQFLPEVRRMECDFSWDAYQPGTWHHAGHPL